MGDAAQAIDIVSSGLTAAKGIGSFFGELFTLVDGVKARQLSKDQFLRAYYLEVIGNLEFLTLVRPAALNKVPPNAPELNFILANIHHEVGAALLFAEDAGSGAVYEFLKSAGRITNKKRLLVRYEHGYEIGVKTRDFYENVLQAIAFTVVKTQILKRLAGFGSAELALLQPIQLERRLVNIIERFRMIKNRLDEIPGIQEMAR